MMRDLEKISLWLFSSNNLFFPFFGISLQQRGCLSETDLHHQRIVVSPQSIPVGTDSRRQYSDIAAPKFEIVSCLTMDDCDTQIFRTLEKFLQLRRRRFHPQP